MRLRNLLVLVLIFSLGVCCGKGATLDEALAKYKDVPTVQKATRERAMILAGYTASMQAIRVQAEIKAQELNGQLAEILRQVEAQVQQRAKAAAEKKAKAEAEKAPKVDAKAKAEAGPVALPAPPLVTPITPNGVEVK